MLNLVGRTPWWWRDPIILAQLQVVFSILGALLALGAVLYAWRVARRQFKLMDEQGQIIDKQRALMQEETETGKRLEALTAKQGEILKRQGEIAETQHRILEERRAQLPQPSIKTGTMSRVYNGTVVPLYIHNDGDATLEGCRWEVIVPRA